mmetsp:Transcript_22295/g.56929  ORF Transcript_22295/g.56929 Transcript_22295/m.56929 type:complete len:407 (+) Transcript_22295:2328-3548(+)
MFQVEFDDTSVIKLFETLDSGREGSVSMDQFMEYFSPTEGAGDIVNIPSETMVRAVCISQDCARIAFAGVGFVKVVDVVSGATIFERAYNQDVTVVAMDSHALHLFAGMRRAKGQSVAGVDEFRLPKQEETEEIELERGRESGHHHGMGLEGVGERSTGEANSGRRRQGSTGGMGSSGHHDTRGDTRGSFSANVESSGGAPVDLDFSFHLPPMRGASASKPIRKFQYPGDVTCLSVSRDDAIVIVGGNAKCARLFDRHAAEFDCEALPPVLAELPYPTAVTAVALARPKMYVVGLPTSAAGIISPDSLPATTKTLKIPASRGGGHCNTEEGADLMGSADLTGSFGGVARSIEYYEIVFDHEHLFTLERSPPHPALPLPLYFLHRCPLSILARNMPLVLAHYGPLPP